MSVDSLEDGTAATGAGHHRFDLLAGGIGEVAVGELRQGPGRRRRQLGDVRALLVFGDLLAVLACLGIVRLVGIDVSAASIAAGSIGVVLAASIAGLPRRQDVMLSKTTLEESSSIMLMSAIGTLAIGATDRGPGAGVVPLIVIAALTFTLLLTARSQIRALGNRMVRPERCVVIGDPDDFEHFHRHFHTACTGRSNLVAMVNLSSVGCQDDGRETVEELIQHFNTDRVIVLASEQVDEAAQISRRSRNAGVTVTVIPRVLETLGPDLVPELIGGSVALSAAPAGLSPAQRLLKRSMDVMGAGLLLASVAPLAIVAGLVIRFTSPGPALFWQTRIGRDGKKFRIAKFRTMIEEAEELKPLLRERNEAEGLFKIAQDPRITPVGRFLRRSALDEIPQLLNVLRGEMSLVGPRPLVCDEDGQLDGWKRDRLRLSPGMTGPWQVLGSARIPLKDMALLDHHYVSNWSLAGDLRILLRTVRFVFGGRGL
jgi:lipopolysaccharide/colanic/teichoic acid biosynthesis glycosyltransferase